MSKQEFAYCILICAALTLGLFSIKLLIVLIPFFMVYNRKCGITIELSKTTAAVIIAFLVYSLCGVVFSDYVPNSLSFNIDLTVLLALYLLTGGELYHTERQKNILTYTFHVIVSAVGVLTGLFYIAHQSALTELGFTDMTDFKTSYRPMFMFCNNFATLVLCFLPIILITILKEADIITRVWYIANFVLCIFCLTTTYSRGIYLSVIVLFFLLIGSLLIFNRLPLKKVLISILTATFFSVALSATNTTIRESVATTFSFNKTESQKRSFDSRVDKLSKYGAEFSIFGCGSGNFKILNLRKLTDYDTLISGSSTNSFLQLYIERGLFGILFFVVMAGLYLLKIRKKLFLGNITAIVSTCGLAAVAVREVTFGSFTNVGGIVLMCFAMICLTLNTAKNEKQ